jgi:hypothetical protein
MSGTGQKNTSAPDRLTPMSGDQPIGQTADGRPVLASMWFNQLIVRILAYLGQPSSSSGTTGGGGGIGSSLTISEQVTQLSNTISEPSSLPAESAGLSGRIAAIEDALPAPWVPAAPTPASEITVQDQTGDVIQSVGTVTFEGVAVSGTSPQAIVNATTITGTAGVGTGDGGDIIISGGKSGTGAIGNGGDVTASGGTPLSTNGDGGNVVFEAGNATGTGAGGTIEFTVGSATPSGIPGRISFIGQPFLAGGTPTIPSVNSNTISGTDQTGLITIGPGATTSVVVTFGGNYPAAPLAVVLSAGNAAAAAAGVGAFAATLSSTGWTLSGTALANCDLYYHAI